MLEEKLNVHVRVREGEIDRKRNKQIDRERETNLKTNRKRGMETQLDIETKREI